MWPLLVALLSLSAAAPNLPKRPPETLALIDQARSLAPEFSAGILLRLAGSHLVSDRKWKQELIEEAFRTGVHAQLPYRQRGESNTDTRSARAVWDNDLEALTLQTRAVEAMLGIDRQRARTLFEEIVFPRVPPRACKDVLRPDLSAYYRVAASVFERSFTEHQRDREEHLEFLERIAGSIHSPVHVGPTIKLVMASRLATAQRQALASTFAVALDRLEIAERASVSSAVDLVPADTAELRTVAPVLVPALRKYIVRQLAAPRCRGAFEIREVGIPAVVADFNRLARALDPAGAAYRPISAEESQPLKEEEGYARHEWWQSTRSKQVLAALRWLNHGNRDLPGDQRFSTLEERRTNEWNARFTDTLKLIEGWKEDEEESADDWFGMVSSAYGMLADKVPPGRQRDVAMGTFLSFMETNYALVENHNLWFTQLRGLWRSKEPWVVEQLSRSVNPVIAVYARTNQLTGAR